MTSGKRRGQRAARAPDEQDQRDEHRDTAPPGWRRTRAPRSPCSVASTLVVIPQSGHGTPVSVRSGHGRPAWPGSSGSSGAAQQRIAAPRDR